HLVGGDGHPRPGPAAHHAHVGSPLGDGAADGPTDVGPGLVAGAAHQLVACAGQPRLQVVGGGGPLGGPEGDAHGTSVAGSGPSVTAWPARVPVRCSSSPTPTGIASGT